MKNKNTFYNRDILPWRSTTEATLQTQQSGHLQTDTVAYGQLAGATYEDAATEEEMERIFPSLWQYPTEAVQGKKAYFGSQCEGMCPSR